MKGMTTNTCAAGVGAAGGQTIKMRVRWIGRLSACGKGRGRRWGLTALLLACLVPGAPVRAQIPILDIINAAVKKVIVATDLEIERMQTETIESQNAEKALENDMAQSELTDITGWVQQQRDLFSEFYTELWNIKNAIATYEEVKDMIEKQGAIVAGYKQVYATLGKDSHFSPNELTAMYGVLSGILNQSVQNIGRLTTVITALVTQMGDGPRLQIIDETGREIDRNYTDLYRFSQGCYLMSAQRAQNADDLTAIRAMYGIQ